jgi:hypothetical protein
MCGDRTCQPEITRVVPSPEAVRLAGWSGAEPQPFNAYLVTDCRGGVLGVQVTDAMDRAVQLAPAEILLSVPDADRSAAQVAAAVSPIPLVVTNTLRLREEE